VWAAGGLMGRLGAAKRRMLSLAERPSPVVAAWEGTFPSTGAAEGIVAGYASIDDMKLQLLRKSLIAQLSVGFRISNTVLSSQTLAAGLADVRTQPKKAAGALLGLARENGAGAMNIVREATRGNSPCGCNAVLGAMQNA
jgi:hypothetical protein